MKSARILTPLLGVLLSGCFQGEFMLHQACREDAECIDYACEGGFCSGPPPDATTTEGTTAGTGSTTAVEPGCGNGVLEAGEECDGDVADPETSRCVDCSVITCEEGTTPAPEESCEGVAADAQSECLSQCVTANCGDGVLDPSEECDDGNDDDTDACTGTCQHARCGDGFVQAGIELCDDGNVVNDDSCSSECGPPTCGDGVVQAPEQCDDGNSLELDECSNACIVPVCGNGVVQGGEDCDDGNEENADACLSDCTAASCGDGYLWVGAEACEDGNDSNFDSCTNECELPICGDGYVWEGVEACDYVAQPGCTEECKPKDCGDGEQSPFEECDDGNMIDTDACPTTCLNATCGDGFHYEEEEACDFGEFFNITLGCTDNCSTLRYAVDLEAGGGSNCVVLVDGSLRCWGRNDQCQLGLGHALDVGDDEYPAEVPDVPTHAPVTAIANGLHHTCALFEGGGLRCWGRNNWGQLGYGDIMKRGCDASETPDLLEDVEVGYGANDTPIDVVVGHHHTCVLTDAGNVHCWGRNANGELGQGDSVNIGDNELPSSISAIELSGPATQIAAGDEFTCAVLEGGGLQCWGNNFVGQLGNDGTEAVGDNETPAMAGLAMAGGTVVGVVTGAHHTCAVLADGDARCWGDNLLGQLGYGHWIFPAVWSGVAAGGGPLDTGGPQFTHLDAGLYFTCGRLDNGDTRCWGQGSSGQLGSGSPDAFGASAGETPATAVTLDFGDDVELVKIVSGRSHTCALFNPPVIRCWGRNIHGQLGHSNTNDIGDDPEEVVFQHNLNVPLFL